MDQESQRLRSRLNHAERAIELLRGDNQNLRKQNQGYRATIEDMSQHNVALQAKVEELEQRTASSGEDPIHVVKSWLATLQNGHLARFKEIKSLHKILAEETDELLNLRVENKELKFRLSHQEASIVGFTQELDELRDRTTVQAPDVSDSVIQAEWDSLNSRIRQFVSKYLQGGSLDTSAWARIGQQNAFSWLPYKDKILRSGMIRPVILESWIWHSLYISIFGAQSEVWAGEAGKTFRISWDQVRGELVIFLVTNRRSVSFGTLHSSRLTPIRSTQGT